MKMLWKGCITFGLINIPVRLHSAYKGTELHFKLLDSRDKSKIRFERINENTGEEVPWDKVVKAYQLNKNQYVFVKDENQPSKNSTDINIEMFVNSSEISPIYIDKPYYLIPDGGNPKAYILFREVLARAHKVGVAKVIIRSREHVAFIYPYQNFLILQLLRFAQEFIRISDLGFIDTTSLDAKLLSSREIELANKLIGNMTRVWRPEIYHDESQEHMLALIRKKAKKEKIVELPEETATSADKTDRNITDLLEKSLLKKQKTSANTKK